MTIRTASLRRVPLPGFGLPAQRPRLPEALYSGRMERFCSRLAEQEFDAALVWADREHSANLAYLSGFDPRFEEALMVVKPDCDPAVLVGNECWATAGAAPLSMRRHMFQDFSLPAQPRNKSEPLSEILREEGIGAGARVAAIGWKEYSQPDQSDLPSYLVDQVRDLVGPSGEVLNTVGMLIDAADGLRVINEIDQLAAYEHAACHTSDGVRNLLVNLEPGLKEQDAVALLGWNGMPLSCHLMLTAGSEHHSGS